MLEMAQSRLKKFWQQRRRGGKLRQAQVQIRLGKLKVL
jgi:hypothetical protein